MALPSMTLPYDADEPAAACELCETPLETTEGPCPACEPQPEEDDAAGEGA